MSSLSEKLSRGEFVVTAEIAPPLSASPDTFLSRVEPLTGLTDAINVTDAASARPALSSLAAAALLAANGYEPVVQLTCRDRNRIALTCDLIGAAALGVRNLLILHGDDPKSGDMPEAKPVFDLDSRGLMALSRDLSQNGQLPSGRALADAPEFFIGCADTPFDPPEDWRPDGLESKIAAGAQFAQTQFCFDLATARSYFDRLVRHGITDRLKFIVGIGPIMSARQARFMNQNLFGVHIPPAIVQRLEGAGDERAEGRAICAELMAGLREIDGICGVHLMAPAQSASAIAETIIQAGLEPR